MSWKHSHRGEKWYSIYVPPATDGVTDHEVYFRLGSPDMRAERRFINALEAEYTDTDTQVAVQAAFGNTPSGGMAFYTDGDLVQFIRGKSDTRILNDSFVVHVLDLPDVEQSATTPAKTYRSYLRLGKPNADVESATNPFIPDDDLLGYVLALAPSTTVDPLTGQETEQVLELNTDAGDTLVAAATTGDETAIDDLDQLRKSTDSRAIATPYNGSPSVNAWALAQLQALELNFANALSTQAILGDATARSTLEAQAKAGDPVVRQTLLAITTSTKPEVNTSYNGLPTAAVWAMGVLNALPSGTEVNAQWTLGNGVAIYSDSPISVTTPSTLKVTVATDSRTVLGPSYTETYDVGPDVIDQIREGKITNIQQISQKRVVTASLVERSTPFWRTVKFDQTKALSYSMNDSGTFSLSSSYTFNVGLKLTNGVSGSYDASFGVGATASLTALKVDVGMKGLTTTGPSGALNYKSTNKVKGASVSIEVDPDATIVTKTLSVTLGKAALVGVGVINAALAAYTGAVIYYAETTTEDSPSPNIKDMLAKGEPVYITAAALNGALLAASLIGGVIQIANETADSAAKIADPAQSPNILVNNAGVKLQCGTSFIHLDPSGIIVSGAQLMFAGPMTSVLPEYLPGNFTPTQIADAVTLGLDIAALADMFGA